MECPHGGLVGIATAAVVLLAACASDPSTSSSTPASAESSPRTSASADALPRIALPVQPGSTVEGLVDVNGHDIYARCSGEGAPTILYFTGWAPDKSKRGVDAIGAVEDVYGGRHRICAYERRNTGRSASVEGTQSPDDIIADVDGLLDALGENGPFLLFGASFGGLVSGAYAVAHPERVAGVLLVDAAIPDDYLIDQKHGFEGLCLQENRQADAYDSLEKIDNCRLAKWAYDRRDREPAVPLIYLAAHDSAPDQRGDPADDKYRKAFVHRWSPGVWEMVNAPHYMDATEPELMKKNLQTIVQLAG